jgi:hypothetical protein
MVGFKFELLQDVIDNQANGPLDDHNGYKIRYFMNVDAKSTNDPSTGATLESPLLIVADHPEECFRFWFSMKVFKKLLSQSH